MTKPDVRDFKPRQVLIVDRKAYMICDYCKNIVRINKPILGSLHLCTEN